jgi:uncharacterized protein (DUF1778 family)
MANQRPVTYTERVAVAVTAEQLERLRRYARLHQTAMSIVLREAALVEIERGDLSLADETQHTIGEMLERRDRPTEKPAKRHGARIVVNLTRDQRRAIERAALRNGTTVSHTLRAAGLKRAKIAAAKDLPLGRPLGH